MLGLLKEILNTPNLSQWASGSTPGHHGSSHTSSSTDDAPPASLVPSRRNRSDLDDSAIDPTLTSTDGLSVTSDFLPHYQKRLKRHGKQVCRDIGLEDDALDEFTNLPSVPLMLIHIAGMQLKSNIAKDLNTALTFIKSAEFKPLIKNRLVACLLAPNLSAYVTDLLPFVLSMMRRSPLVWKIPPIVFEDDEVGKALEKVIGSILTNARSNMKGKITASLVSKEQVSVLAQSLMPKGLAIGPQHWTRVAFLRNCLVEFNNILRNTQDTAVVNSATDPDSTGPTNPGSPSASDAIDFPSDDEHPGNSRHSDNGLSRHHSSTPDVELNAAAPSPESDDTETPKQWSSDQFWNYVDHILSNLRDFVRATKTDDFARQAAMQQFFTRILQQDISIYKAGKPKAMMGGSTDWQEAFEAELGWL